MATKKQIECKQKKLDALKWRDSEEKGVDTCGTYDYCVNCNKSSANPCAKAFYNTNRKKCI